MRKGDQIVNYATALTILTDTKPARSKTVRHKQRDELQHTIVPLLPAADRDRFERKMNSHFRL